MEINIGKIIENVKKRDELFIDLAIDYLTKLQLLQLDEIILELEEIKKTINQIDKKHYTLGN